MLLAVASAKIAGSAAGGLASRQGYFTDKDEERKAEMQTYYNRAIAGDAGAVQWLLGRADYPPALAIVKAAPTAKSRNYAKGFLQQYYATTGEQPAPAVAAFLGIAEPVAVTASTANRIRAALESGAQGVARDVERERINEIKVASVPYAAIAIGVLVLAGLYFATRKAG